MPKFNIMVRLISTDETHKDEQAAREWAEREVERMCGERWTFEDIEVMPGFDDPDI